MRLAIASLLALASLTAVGGAQNRPAKTLDTYYIDVEGGLSALYVSPTGESLLIDTGSPGGRDSGRIIETLKMAGIKQIDHMLLTHYHGDHAGGLQELSQQIPIKHFYDHGPNSEPTDQVTGFRAMYDQLLAKAEHTVLKPGDKIPFAGTTIDCGHLERTDLEDADRGRSRGWATESGMRRFQAAGRNARGPGQPHVGWSGDLLREVPHCQPRRFYL